MVKLKKWTDCDTVYAVYILVEMTKTQIIHVNCLGFGGTVDSLLRGIWNSSWLIEIYNTCQNVCVVHSVGLKVSWSHVNS